MIHTAAVERDRARLVRIADPSDRNLMSAQLCAISPNSPVGRAKQIELNWADATKDWPELAREHRDQPEILVALGQHDAVEKRWDDAEKSLTAAIKISPDRETYIALAGVYKSMGKMDRWQETLDAYLAAEDPGLGHAQVRVELARYFMGRREYDKAQPYAEAAAQTWAGWAMQCAAECYEAMGRWDQAELWYSRMTERYSNNRMAWFFFCARTGHGDRDAAAEFMDHYIAGTGDSASRDNLNHFAVYYILTNRSRQALEIYQRLAALPEDKNGTGSDSFFYKVNLALLADELGEKDLCVRTLDDAVKSHEKKAPRMSSICRLLHAWLAAPNPGALDLGPVNQVFDAMPDLGKANFGYYLGRFLEQHGRPKEALKYLGSSANLPQTPYLLQYLAYNALRKQGVKVGPGGEL